MTQQQFESLRAKQDLSDLHYPSAIEWMWDYCLFLGKFTDGEGNNYDLGVHYAGFKDFAKFSLAIVCGNEPGNYSSGHMNYHTIPSLVNDEPNIERRTLLQLYKEFGFEHYVECWNRLQTLLANL